MAWVGPNLCKMSHRRRPAAAGNPRRDDLTTLTRTLAWRSLALSAATVSRRDHTQLIQSHGLNQTESKTTPRDHKVF